MPSIIFVIYSGHKAREKSKLESEAKKRQKERAQRGPDGGQRSGQVQSAAANFAQSASSEVKTPKPKPEPITVATQTYFQDEKPRKPNSDSGRLSSASNRDRNTTERYGHMMNDSYVLMFYFRVKSSTATRRRTRADSSDSDPETTPLCTKEMNEIEKVCYILDG